MPARVPTWWLASKPTQARASGPAALAACSSARLVMMPHNVLHPALQEVSNSRLGMATEPPTRERALGRRRSQVPEAQDTAPARRANEAVGLVLDNVARLWTGAEPSQARFKEGQRERGA